MRARRARFGAPRAIFCRPTAARTAPQTENSPPARHSRRRHARRRDAHESREGRGAREQAVPGADADAMPSRELSKTEKKYNKKEIFVLKAVFDDADVDGSGEIDLAELRKALNKTNLGNAAEDMFKAIDKDGSKKIGFDEYLKVRSPAPRPSPKTSIAPPASPFSPSSTR